MKTDASVPPDKLELLHRIAAELDDRRDALARAQQARTYLIDAYALVGADLQGVIERLHYDL
jgi:hypothetical protein